MSTLNMQLLELFHDCSESNWDGYGALPISEQAYVEAARFLAALPAWLPIPELVPEPSGAIGFEWNFGEGRVFVASVDGTNTISYAGILGGKVHGTEVFDGSIHQTIIDHIAKLRK